MTSGFADAFNDTLQLIKTESAIFADFPYEIYHTMLIWLPRTVCQPLACEREARQLPSVEYGLPETWLPPDLLEGKELVPAPISSSPSQKSPPGLLKERGLVAHSLSTFPNSPLARWLSTTDHGEITVHEWDTKTNHETKYYMGRPTNIKVITKIASNGIFFFDPDENILSFKPLGLTTAPLREKKWRVRNCDGLLKSDQKNGMDVSVNGQYATLWNQDQQRILLINIDSIACYWLPLANRSDFLSTDNFDLHFSPDEMYLAVCFSDTT